MLSFPFRRGAQPASDAPMGLMLDGLEEVNWAKLEHAYGSAKDVPSLLRDLASRDKPRGEKAIHAFYGNIYHQGTVYEATASAVPFLLRIAEDAANLLRSETLMLLSSLAYGHSYHDVHQHLMLFEQERAAPNFQAKIATELSWVERAHLAVGEGVPVYLSLFQDSNREVRATSAYLASLFARENDSVAPALLQRLETEDDEFVRASLWLGLGLSPQIASGTELDGAFEDAESDLERWAICATMLRLRRSDAPSIAVETMIGVLQSQPEELSQAYRDVPFNEEGLVADSAQLLLYLGEDARRFRVPLCEALRRTTNVYGAMTLLETILPLFVGEFSREKMVEWNLLDEDGREVVQTLLESDGVWGDGKSTFGNLAQLVEHFGLSYDREKLRVLVLGSSPTP